ncbi:DeoR/GlpR family DNA-binding transcription regulator [Nocardioides sp.]|uniref:DeoR/GlpR family DNA-binding transcription regulator n=1 Tax=Nocardioides sp. TaxID=35761 RepID=UPI00261BCCD5|nr:DeoR/GlpR family DNA-binding transcription regulator [Nocardioides sp.]
MDVTTRRGAIEELITRVGEVQFAELAERFGVSEMTVRRDIEALQKAGVVRRVSGGAIAAGSTALEPPYDTRAGHAAGPKARIAAAVVDLLVPGETVALDSGSTVAAVAAAIRGRGLGLTVLTPAIGVALTLADEPDTTVILTGGVVRPGEHSLIGSEAEGLFARFNCDTFVIGVAGVDAERGLSDYHPAEAGVKRAAITASRRLIVGADASKLGRVHLASVAPLDRVAALVTDADPSDPTVVAASATGAAVVHVHP